MGGSIYGADIELDNCVVIGGVFASKSLALSDVMVGTFHTPDADLNGTNYLLYPTAFSVEPMRVLPGATLHCLALADLGALYKGEKELPQSGQILMDLSADAQLQHTYALNRKDGVRTPDLTIENISKFLFAVLQGRVKVRDLDGRVTFSELKERFG